eukprot:71882-Pyramimonas_sp.AAC.1
MPAVSWTTVADSGHGKRPPPAPLLWCREHATPVVPWATVADSGRRERPVSYTHLRAHETGAYL